MEDEDYFRVQWFYRAEDTVSIYLNQMGNSIISSFAWLLLFQKCFSQVLKEEAASHDKKRLFCSDMMNDNLLDCIVSKVKIIQRPPSVC